MRARDIEAAAAAPGSGPTPSPRLSPRAAAARPGRADHVRRAHGPRPRPDRLPIPRPPRRALSGGHLSVPAAGRRHRRPAPGSSATSTRLRLTGLPVINHDLRRQFLPQFLKGIAIGTAAVAVLIYVVFRTVRHTLLALLPTAVGFVWSAGVLALLRVELDLFSLFAAVTFVGIAVDYGIYVLHRYVLEPSSGMEDVMTKTGAAIIIACAHGAHRLRHPRQLELRAAARLRHRVDRHADLLPDRVDRVSCRRSYRDGTMVTLCALIAAFNEEAHVADVVKGGALTRRRWSSSTTARPTTRRPERATPARSSSGTSAIAAKGAPFGPACEYALASSARTCCCSTPTFSTIRRRSHGSSRAAEQGAATWSSASASSGGTRCRRRASTRT